MKQNVIDVFNKEDGSKIAKKTDETIKNVVKRSHFTWSLDLSNMIDYEIKNNKGYKYISAVFDSFCKYGWCIALENWTAQSKTNKIFNTFHKFYPKPIPIETVDGKEVWNTIFTNFYLANFLGGLLDFLLNEQSLLKDLEKQLEIYLKGQFLRKVLQIGLMNYYKYLKIMQTVSIL